MALFRELPGFVRSPSGIERTVLRHLLPAAAWGTLAVGLGLLAVRLLGIGNVQDSLSMFEIYLMSLLLLYWNVLLFAAIAAFIVMVMKGPAYVADAYPLPDESAVAGSGH